MDSHGTPLALDRSLRRKDADGHLHVEWSNISKANVCPYFGREIPNAAEMGLDPERAYLLYRDPAELAAAASTFAGKPLLLHHKPVTSDDHPTELVIGSVGSTVEWVAPYLRAPLSVWRQDGIDAIETDDEESQQRELSPGYRYTADMTPGTTPEGVAFHGRMRNIMGNHVTIVKEGRTGPDVIVADQAPAGLSDMRFKTFFTALAAAFPSLKAEQVIALDAALDAEMKKPCVEDEFPGMDYKAAMDAYCARTGKAMDAMSDEDKRAAFKAAKDAATGGPATGKPATGMDEAAVTQRVTDAVAAAVKDHTTKVDATKLAQDAATAARAEVHALYAARKDVETTAGVVALDSAEAVYRFALDHLKVDHKGTDGAGLPALYKSSAQTAAAPTLATDAAVAFDPSILGLSHIRKG